MIAVLLCASSAPGAAELTDLERQRLVAHLEMTAGWLQDEVANLSPAQLEFRRAAGTWSILEVIDHLVVVGQIYWEDLQNAMKGPPSGADLSRGDDDILWYGIDRTHRETAVASENPKRQLRDLRAGLETYRRHHGRLLQYVKTTKDDLRGRIVPRQRCDAYQWALLISTHEQRHILQIREIKADAKFPKSQGGGRR
jgi:uncharacterized damage-inducible protein DinB